MNDSNAEDPNELEKSDEDMSQIDKDQDEDEVEQISDYDFDEDDLISDGSSDGEDTDNYERFDDEALIGYLKHNQKFISIDLMIQMEYCSGLTLQMYLETKERQVDRQEVYIYFKQMLSAVKHIH